MWLITFAPRVLADAPTTALAIAPDGVRIAIGSQRGVEIRNGPNLETVATLETELENVHDLRFSPDGRTLLAAGGAPAERGIVECWSWPDLRRNRQVAGHTDVVYRVAWSPDGTKWASCGGDGRCQVHDAATAALITGYDGHSRAVLAIQFLDSRTVVSAGVDQTLRLWNGETGAHLRTLDNHVAAVNDLAVKPGDEGSAEMVASAGEDRTVRLWNPRIGRLMRFARLPSAPRCLTWSADGSHLWVGCNDGRVRAIDAESMEVLRELDGLPHRIHAIELNARTGRLLVAGEAGRDVVDLDAASAR